MSRTIRIEQTMADLLENLKADLDAEVERYTQAQHDETWKPTKDLTNAAGWGDAIDNIVFDGTPPDHDLAGLLGLVLSSVEEAADFEYRVPGGWLGEALSDWVDTYASKQLHQYAAETYPNLYIAPEVK